MKHVFTLIVCMLLVPFMLCAQSKRNGEVSKELQEFKIKFLAQEMDLKPEQQTRFVEVYTRMSAEKRKAFATAFEIEHKVKSDKNASPEDYQKATDAMARAKIQEGQIDKKYDAEFKKFLTAKQIYQLKEGEKKFRQKMKELRAKKKR